MCCKRIFESLALNSVLVDCELAQGADKSDSFELCDLKSIYFEKQETQKRSQFPMILPSMPGLLCDGSSMPVQRSGHTSAKLLGCNKTDAC